MPAATFLGTVRQVTGSKITVEISDDLPSSSPIVSGHVHRLGQIGSFVRIPLGFIDVYGIVSMVGVSPLDSSPETVVLDPGRRWLQVQLVGEAFPDGQFQRGVGIFPTLDDEVHVVTEDDLAIIYSHAAGDSITIGTHSASAALPARIDLDRFVTRHSAIVGSTGSGKSNTVAAILRAITDGDYPAARVVVVDPHGEYASAFPNNSQVFRIDDADHPLHIPYWAMSFDELAWFLVDRRTASETQQDLLLRDKIFAMRQERIATLKKPVDAARVTADAPIPFSVKELWYHFDRLERVTFQDMPRTQEALVQEGDAEALRSAEFTPPGAGSAPPFRPQPPSFMAGPVSKIIARLRDRRFDFLLNPGRYDGVQLDLDDLLNSWLGGAHAVTILDLAGVPSEIIDLVVGVVTRILFDASFWGHELPGIGPDRPLLLVYEEAHSYLPRNESSQFIAGHANRAVRRVLKEGRKYGIGALVVSQRPSEVDDTILSQCGTFIALRLTNPQDQGHVRSVVPDSLAGLIDLLPALRTGEALVLGEALPIPSRVQIPLVEPRPHSEDPVVSERWKASDAPDLSAVVERWREQRPTQ